MSASLHIDSPGLRDLVSRLDALYQDILGAIDAPPEATEALDDAIGALPERAGVRRIMGDLIANTYRERHPEAAQRAAPFLNRAGRAPFSITPLKVAIAYTAFFGSLVSPEADLVTATNQVIEDTFTHRRDHPFVKTFLRVAEGDWELFIGTAERWGPLFSNMKHADIETLARGHVEVTYATRFAPALSYVTLGMMRGLMNLFEVSTGEVEQSELDDALLVLQVRW